MPDAICAICPRACQSGAFCGKRGGVAVVAKAMIHMWEEPCVSGGNGSGTVFFAGCNLRCVFCQNHEISQTRPLIGVAHDADRLAALFWDLQSQNAENINLVTPDHVLPITREAIVIARRQGIALPFIWNSNAYVNQKPLQSLASLVDIFLPDLKYCDPVLSLRYAQAADYFFHAGNALCTMRDLVGLPQYGGNGMMRRGMMIRHLVLPGCRKDSMRLLDWLRANIPDVPLSLMAQYTPMHLAKQMKPLNRRLTGFEYESVLEYAMKIGLTVAYQQGRGAATPTYTPDFLR
ncbi:MAG: radical SAM protein [Oscillospiraceae bacterium]|nr:radical SAM protein [Oscillospiraceae bacterium]